MEGEGNLFGTTPSPPARDHMSDYISMVLLVLVLALFGVALYALAAGQMTVAGLSFLSASITIYLRETRLRDEGP